MLTPDLKQHSFRQQQQLCYSSFHIYGFGVERKLQLTCVLALSSALELLLLLLLFEMIRLLITIFQAKFNNMASEQASIQLVPKT